MLISVPWMVCFHLLVPYFLGTIYMYQFVYFTIICQYLKLKLKTLNKDIADILSTTKQSKCTQTLKTRRILRRITAIHKEIKNLNDEMWSKFLLIFIVANIAVGNFSFYVYIFVDIALIVKIAFLYCTVLWLSMLCFILNDVSAIVSQINKSRKLIKLFANPDFNIHVNTKMKVI